MIRGYSGIVQNEPSHWYRPSAALALVNDPLNELFRTSRLCAMRMNVMRQKHERKHTRTQYLKMGISIIILIRMELFSI